MAKLMVSNFVLTDTYQYLQRLGEFHKSFPNIHDNIDMLKIAGDSLMVDSSRNHHLSTQLQYLRIHYFHIFLHMQGHLDNLNSWAHFRFMKTKNAFKWKYQYRRCKMILFIYLELNLVFHYDGNILHYLFHLFSSLME